MWTEYILFAIIKSVLDYNSYSLSPLYLTNMALSPEIIEELKQKLLAEKKQLESELEKFAKPTGASGSFETTFDNIGTDPDDNATEVEEYVDNLALENTLESQLKDVNDALRRMEEGSYGTDETTGKEISLERLRVYPAARTAL